MARKLALSDNALAEDLEQEGVMALWLLDPSTAKTNESAMIRTAIWRRMVDFLRGYDPAHYESLDARFETGDQLEKLDSGELRLRTTRTPLPKLIDETEWESLDENAE